MLKVVREPGHRKYVLELRRKAGVRVGSVAVVLLGLLTGLGSEKRRIIGPLAMNQWDEAEVRQLLFAPVGYGNFGGALQRNIAVISLEGVGGQPFHQPSALNAPNRSAPAELREGVRQAGRKRIRGVPPQILLVLLAVHVLFEPKRLDRRGRLTIRQAHQNVRKTEPYIAGIF